MTPLIPELQPYPIDANIEGLPYCLGEDGHIAMRDGSKAKLDGAFVLRKGFVQYANGFSRDEKAVYCWGHRVAGANPATFRVLSRTFVTDGNHVWTHMGKVKDADPATFIACDHGSDDHWSHGYGKDANSVFFSPGSQKTRRVIKAAASNFRSCDDTCLVGYDDDFAFAEGASIRKAKRKSWRYLSNSYSRDEKTIFYLGRPIEGADLATFEVVPVYSRFDHGPAPLARDKNHYYWGENIIDDDEYGAGYWVNYAVVSDPNDMPPIARERGFKLENPILGSDRTDENTPAHPTDIACQRQEQKRRQTMQLPTWEQFSALFADANDEQAHAVREAFIQKHNEREGDQATSSVEDYANALVTLYGYFLDYKEGTFGVTEWLEEKFGDAFTANFDDDNDTVKVRFGGKEIVLSHHSMGTDEFEQDLAQLERLMEEQYYFLYRYPGEGVASDTLELLLVPAEHWRQAEQFYGQAQVSAHFRRCVNEEPCAPQVKAPSSGLAASRHSSEESEWNTFYRLRANMFLWLILPVIVIFALSVLWGVLKGNTLLPPQPKGCENVDKVFRNLPAEQAAPLKEHMRQQLGCNSE